MHYRYKSVCSRLTPPTNSAHNRTVARLGPSRTKQVLRHGSQGEGATHATVPGLERSRQLRDTLEEEEAQERQSARARQQQR